MLIVHAADIHLDSPLAGLTLRAGERASDLVGATRRAFTALVDHTIEIEASLLLIAGDLYDGDWRDFSTGLFFVSEMARLDRAGIRVGVIKGNHDAENQMTRSLTWPGNVKVFRSDRAETWTLDGLSVAVHGRSFPKRDVTENIALAYPDPVPGLLNIGMLHTAADGRPGHAFYAPCSIRELVAKGYDYWALGHIHARAVLSENPWVVFPGNLQGRHANEAGPKGATVLTVDGHEITGVEHVTLDVVRWEHVRVDLSGSDEYEDALARVRDVLSNAVDAAEGRTLAARLTISGRTPLHSELAGDLERTRAECLGIAQQVGGDVWVERVVLQTEDFERPVASTDADAIAELLRTVDEILKSSEEMNALKASLEQSLTRVPARVRELAGLKEVDDGTLVTVLEGATATLRHRLLGAG
ncbi:MAG: DNA repair exonuclease [Nisaea sp.]|uniref:metallophosphoesterase family protein n=1 Tax=Nisaea sp. TaxID=2024842 RepID=UPI001B0336E8|nr:DNA repair exonuclease [Nisaea sp.]MBO6560114.1 DNA repair exonuclease [Nisaea sp.]